MEMSTTLMGGIAGLLVGFATFLILGTSVRKMMRSGNDQGAKTLDFVRKFELVSMPFICAFIGYVIGNGGTL